MKVVRFGYAVIAPELLEFSSRLIHDFSGYLPIKSERRRIIAARAWDQATIALHAEEM